MKLIHIALLVAPFATVATAQDAPPVERVVPVGGIVDVTIGDARGWMRIDPGAPGLPLLDDGFARRVGMKPGGFALGFLYAIGRDRFSYLTNVKPFDLSASSAKTTPSKKTGVKRRIGAPWRPSKLGADAPWTPHSYAGIVDGTLSPIALPDPVVRLQLRDPRPGDRTLALPMVDGGGMFGRFTGLYAYVDIGGAPMRVRLDPYHPRSWANVGAGLRLATAHGGRVAGPPLPVAIAFGVDRSARVMTLERPLAIGPLAIRTIGVRLPDSAGTSGLPETDGHAGRSLPATGIPDADVAPEKPDPDEIVVTAKGKRDTKNDRISIGADYLDACSSIVIDKPAKQIRLTCG